MNSSQEYDRKQFLQPTVQAINTVLGLPVCIWLFDETAHVFRIVAAAEFLEKYISVMELGLTDSVGGEVFRTGKTAVVNNIGEDSRWKYKDEWLGMRLNSAIVEPLQIKGKSVGILDVYIPENQSPNIDELKPKVEIFAEQIAATLRQVRGLEMLNEIGHLINSEIERSEDFFERIMQSAQRVLDCEHVSIFLADDKTEELILNASSSPHVQRKRFKAGEGLAGHAAQTGKSLIVSDVRQNYFFIKGLSSNIQERSMLLSPIKLQDKVIGIISADRHGLNGFDEYDRMLMEVLAKHASSAVQNMGLFGQLKKQRELQIKAIGEISASIAASLELDRVLDSILHWANRLMKKASLCEIRLFDRKTNELVLKRFSGKEINKEFHRVLVGKGITGWVAQYRKPLIIPDVSQDERYLPFIENTRSEIAVPIKKEEELIGVLNIEHPHLNAFTEDDLNLAGAIANLAAIAINNARIYEQLKVQRESQTKAIRDISASIVASLELKQVLEKILDWTISLIREGSLGEIRLLNTDTNELVAEYPKEGIQHTRIPVGEGITGWVAQHKKSLLVPDVSKDSRYKPCRWGIGSELAVPMLKDDKLIGVLNIEHPRVNAFTEDDVKLAGAISNLASVAIENARQREAQVEAIGKISASIVGTLELNRVIDEILDWTRSVMAEASLTGVLLPDREKKQLITTQHRGKTVNEKYLNVPMGKGITGWVAQHKQPLYVPDVSNDERYLPSVEGIQSEIAVPMMIEDKLIGVLNIEHHQINAFTEHDFNLAVAIGNLAAIAIENARLYEEIQKSRDELDLRVQERTAELLKERNVQASLYKISEAAHNAQNLETLYPLIHNIIKELMPAENYYLVIENPATRAYEIPYCEDEKKECHQPAMLMERGLAGCIFKTTGEPRIISPEIRDDLIAQGQIDLIGDPSKSWLGVRLEGKDKPIGVMVVQSYHKELIYGDEEKDIFQFVSKQIAMAIERVRSQEELRKRTLQLNAAYKISEAAYTARHLEELYPELHKIISELMPAKNFFIVLHNSATNEFFLPYFRDKYDNTLPLDKIMERGLTGYVFRTEQPLITSSETRHDLMKEGIEVIGTPSYSWLGVPLKSHDKCIGVIVVQSYNDEERFRYGEAEKNILMFVSTQIATAIERFRAEEELLEHNTRLEQLVKKRTAQREAAYKISEAAHIVQNLETLYPEIHKIVRELMTAENFYIAIYDSVAETFCLVYFKDEKDNTLPANEIFEKGLTGYVFRKGDPLLATSDVFEDLVNRGEVEKIGTPPIDWLGVPLKVQNETIGVMAVQSYTFDIRYGNSEKDMLMFVSREIANAINRVRSQEKLKEHTDQISTAYKISKSALAMRSLNEFYPSIHNIVRELMPAQNLYIALYDSKTRIVSFPYYSDEYDEKPEPRKDENGLTEHILHTGKSLTASPDDFEKIREKHGVTVTGTVPAYFLGVPLSTQNKTTGVLAVYTYNEGIKYGKTERDALLFVSEQIAMTIERIQAQEELENHKINLENLVHGRTAELNAAYEISEAAHTAKNLDELYPLIHNIVSMLMPAKNFYIALYDETTHTRTFPYFKNEYKEAPPNPVSIEKGLSGYVLQTQKPLLGTPQVLAELSEKGIIKRIGKPSKSWLGVPLKTQEKTIGVLAVHSYDEVVYQEKHLEILIFVSEQIAMAIERVRSQEHLERYRNNLEKIVKKLEQSNAQLNAAYKISEAAHRSENLGNFYESVHEIIKGLMSAENFRIITFNSDGKISGFPYFIDLKDKDSDLQREIIEKGKAGYVFKTEAPLLIKDRQDNENRLKDKIELLGSRAESWLGVPLKKADGKAIGVLTVYDYDKKGVYGKSEQDILMFVSTQIATAIERVHSTERLEKLNRQKEVVINLAQKLTSSIQLKEGEIFDLIHKNASELMDADNMYIALYDEVNEFVYFPLAYKNGEPTTIPERKAGEGKTEEIIRTKKPLFHRTRKESEEWYYEDPKTKKLRPGRGEYMGDPLASWIGVPMMVGEKLLGVVATYHPIKDYVYSEDDLNILRLMANNAAIALNNARLYHRLIEAQNKIANVTEINTRTMIAADFVHKLNNLAGAIPIWVDQIREHVGGLKDETLSNYLTKIGTDVENLLSAARQISSQSEEDINIKSVLESLFRRTRLNQPDNINSYLECREKLPKIHFVLLELENILGSVIQNALDAMSEGGNLSILVQEISDCVEIQIRDTGIGVPAEKMNKIFSPFHSTKTGHMGYGLWRAKDIIEKNGGTIEFKSKEGHGTTVIIRIPALNLDYS